MQLEPNNRPQNWEGDGKGHFYLNIVYQWSNLPFASLKRGWTHTLLQWTKLSCMASQPIPILALIDKLVPLRFLVVKHWYLLDPNGGGLLFGYTMLWLSLKWWSYLFLEVCKLWYINYWAKVKYVHPNVVILWISVTLNLGEFIHSKVFCKIIYFFPSKKIIIKKLSVKIGQYFGKYYSLSPAKNLQKASPQGINYIFSLFASDTCIQNLTIHPLDLCKISNLGTIV